MAEIQSGETPKDKWPTILAGGCLVILYIILCIIVATTGFVYKGRFPQFAGDLPTPTMIATPTPGILVRPPDNQHMTKFEDFASDLGDWSLYYQNGKVQVVSGKLILESNLFGHPALSENPKFISVSETYYVQADFTTDTSGQQLYGLVFGLSESSDTYYLFSITPGTHNYQLYKYNTGKWDELVPNSSANLLPYPEANTLSVYFEKGNIELYINGNLMSSYLDKQPLQFNGVGAYVGDSGYRLIVDNFFAYSVK
jgi:hypothetical protein